MRKVKSYEDFINEEINLKKALVGGALATSLVACGPNDGKRTINVEPYEDEQRIIDSIEGIFIDLEDDGFIVDTTLGWEKLLVIIHNDEPEWDSEDTVFTYSQIEDKVLMLIDYIKKKWGDKLLIKYIYKKLKKVNMNNPFKWSNPGPFSDNYSKIPPKSDDRINSFNISIKKDNSTGLLNKLLGK